MLKKIVAFGASNPMFLLSTSPGRRGGKTVLAIALNNIRLMNNNTIVLYSLPSFKVNFSEEHGIADEDLRQSFEEQLRLFQNALEAI